jgi:hypothetical protein
VWVSLINSVGSLSNTLLRDIAYATSQGPTSNASLSSNALEGNGAQPSWFSDPGWIDRDTYTSVDNITITISVKSGPATSPSEQKTATQIIHEIVTTTVDPVLGDSTQEAVSIGQPGTQSPTATTGATSSGPQILQETVSISDQRSTTETSYSSALPSQATIANIGNPATTIHTTTISDAGGVSENLVATRTAYEGSAASEPSVAYTLNSLVDYFSNSTNLKNLLKGPYAPTFVNTSA